MITAVKTGRLLDVDCHPEFSTLMEHKAFFIHLIRTFMHTREKEVFILNALKISLAPTPQEGSFQVMFAVTQHTKEQKELNTRDGKVQKKKYQGHTREREGQDATKISSAFADSFIQFPWSVMSMLIRMLCIRMLCLCLALTNLLFRVARPSSNFVTMAVLRPRCVVKSDRWSLDDDGLRVKTIIMELSQSLETASTWSSMRKA